MSSPDPPTGLSAHRMWFRDIVDSEKVKQYMDNLIIQYCGGDFAAVGPGDWYVSEAALYKATGGLKHECFVATLQLAPRTQILTGHEPETSGAGDESKRVYLTLERRMDQTKEGRGASPENDMLPEDKGPSDPTSSLTSSEIKTKSLLGKHLASDTASLSMSPKKWNYRLLLRIEFPSPSTNLPHEEDLDAILRELSAPDQLHPSSEPRSFVSLPTLISLANVISQDKETYEVAGSNCYWYSSMIFFCLRRYTASQIIISEDQKIYPDDSVEVMKEKLESEQLKRGYFKKLQLVKIPEDEAVAEALAKWEPQRGNMNEKIRTHRLARIEAQLGGGERIRRIENEMENARREMENVRREMENARREMENARREMENVRREMENARRIEEERLRSRGWVDKDINDFFEY